MIGYYLLDLWVSIQIMVQAVWWRLAGSDFVEIYGETRIPELCVYGLLGMDVFYYPEVKDAGEE